MSFKEMQLVSGEQIQSRLETVKELKSDTNELYEIVKDQETGEHYLHYAYLHVNVAEGNQEESYHHLLPIESDDVLGLIFGEQEFGYPVNWKRAYLRNGPEGNYVWFDPGASQEADRYEKMGEDIKQLLLEFKQGENKSEAKVRELFERLDRVKKEGTIPDQEDPAADKNNDSGR
ncbi:hypothetical protein [Paenibacillus sp. y28]|uniref:hypothetical protein n=1 Tax=Paenibacillus sp. y28 TaxID=3129110 RepID=UPI00301AFE21